MQIKLKLPMRLSNYLKLKVDSVRTVVVKVVNVMVLKQVVAVTGKKHVTLQEGQSLDFVEGAAE